MSCEGFLRISQWGAKIPLPNPQLGASLLFTVPPSPKPPFQSPSSLDGGQVLKQPDSLLTEMK